MTSTASVLGIRLVIPIGGADMPVVISLLNAYSGLAAAGHGWVLNNSVRIIAGSLVGAAARGQRAARRKKHPHRSDAHDRLLFPREYEHSTLTSPEAEL